MEPTIRNAIIIFAAIFASSAATDMKVWVESQKKEGKHLPFDFRTAASRWLWGAVGGSATYLLGAYGISSAGATQ